MKRIVEQIKKEKNTDKEKRYAWMQSEKTLLRLDRDTGMAWYLLQTPAGPTWMVVAEGFAKKA